MEPVGYAELLEQVKVRVRTSRVQAARAVNTELVGLYWHIGRLILDRQESEGWGSKVIGRLAADLRAEFPGMRGLSQRSLVYMRTFAAAFEAPIAQQPAAQLPWGHIMVLLDKVTDPEARQWYAAQVVEHGWSRAVLTHHIATNRRGRVGEAPNNFPTTLAAAESDLPRPSTLPGADRSRKNGRADTPIERSNCHRKRIRLRDGGGLAVLRADRGHRMNQAVAFAPSFAARTPKICRWLADAPMVSAGATRRAVPDADDSRWTWSGCTRCHQYRLSKMSRLRMPVRVTE